MKAINNHNNPIITIIIPVYNTEAVYLEKCFSPFLTHFDNRIEVLCVDDGSNETTAKLLDDISRRASTPIYVSHRNNGGQNAARNAGIYMARGKYIEFLDSDDYIDWDAQKRILDILEKSSCDLLTVDCVEETSQGNQLKRQTLDADGGKRLNRKKALCNCAPLWHQIISKELIQNTIGKLPEGTIRIGEDIASVVPLIVKAEHPENSGVLLYHNVARESSVTHSVNEKYLLDIIKAFDLIERQLAEKNDDYKTEIEWLAVRHILIQGTARVIEQKGIHAKEIKTLRDYVNLHYPDWESNPYQYTDVGAKGIRYLLLSKKHYLLFKILLTVKKILH